MSRETFTAYPNRYTDRIKPKLSATQRDVCDLVIRKTHGWHRLTAPISNSEFIKRTRRSERAIIAAKKQLSAIGLLVIEKPGGGKQIGEYRLDLYYDSKPRQQESTPDPQEASQETPEVSQEIQEPMPEQLPEPDPQETPSQSQESDSKDQPEIPKQDDAHESSSDEVSEAHTPELSAAVPIPDPGSNNIYKKKQTEAGEKAERKKAAAAVCLLLQKYGFRIQSDNYAFIGWAIKHYGADMVNHKLAILKYQGIRGIQVHNVFAWLRKALTCDYQHSAFDQKRIKAEAKAQKRQEYSQAWYDQQERQRVQVQAERDDPEAQARIAAAQAAFWNGIGGEAVA